MHRAYSGEMEHRVGASLDVLLYGASALAAQAVPLTTDVPLDREWARVAAPGYAAGALVAALLPMRRASLGARVLLAGAVFAAVALVPLAVHVDARADPRTDVSVKSDVLIVEGAAEALVHRANPYAVTYHDGLLASWPRSTRTHFPYLPATLVFGMPRALGGPAGLADARVSYLLMTLLIAGAALAWSTIPAVGRLRAFQVMLVLATGAPLVYTSGKELPVLALLLASLVALDRGRTLVAGAAAGIAAAAHQLAWIVLPFLALVPGDRSGPGGGRRAIVVVSATMIATIGPFIVWDARAFADDAVWYPLGFGQSPGDQRSFTPGSLLASALPETRWVLVVLLVAVLVGGVVVLGIRAPHPFAGDVARRAGLLLLVVLLLAPRTRIAYFAFPLNLLLWAHLLQRVRMPPPSPAKRPPTPAAVSAGRGLRAGVGSLISRVASFGG